MKPFRLIAALLLFCMFSISTQAGERSSHGLALYGEPKYNSLFSHLDYVNPNAPKGGTLKLAAMGTYDTVNPYTLKGMAASHAGLMFETLTESSMDEPFTQYGRIAERIIVPDDRSWVAFTLRQQARFNDGERITADDVVYTFNTLKEKGHPFYRTYYKDIKSVEKKGDHYIKFIFTHNKNSELPLIIGQMPVLPKHYWEKKDFEKTILHPVVGSGPYEIQSISAGRSITYKRVKNWWGKDLPINKGRYNFDSITVDYYRDASVATEAFLAGQYDFRLENIAKNWATAYNTPDVKTGLIKKEKIKNAQPAGMQGFVFNTRRTIFKDPRVREAISLAFDFEWSNKTLAYGAYTRTNSYFANSELAAKGLPSPEEKKILKEYEKKLPPEVFKKIYQAPKTDGSGLPRENLRRAAEILKQAGWELVDGSLVNNEGTPMTFEIVDGSPIFDRWVQPFVRNLERLGIKAIYRIVDSAQYQNLMNDFNFDMTIAVFPQSLNPGNEQRDFWTSAKANEAGSRNIIGIKNSVVDDLIEKIINVRSRHELLTLTRALDRVLLWGHYVIPHWYIDSYRIAYWDKFGRPKVAPKYGLDISSLWWFDKTKGDKLINNKKGIVEKNKKNKPIKAY